MDCCLIFVKLCYHYAQLSLCTNVIIYISYICCFILSSQQFWKQRGQVRFLFTKCGKLSGVIIKLFVGSTALKLELLTWGLVLFPSGLWSEQETVTFLQASLVVQLVKNPPAMRETWIRSLGWEGPLKRGKATHSCILAWRSPWTVLSIGSQKSLTGRSNFHFHFRAALRLGLLASDLVLFPSGLQSEQDTVTFLQQLT